MSGKIFLLLFGRGIQFLIVGELNSANFLSRKLFASSYKDWAVRVSVGVSGNPVSWPFWAKPDAVASKMQAKTTTRNFRQYEFITNRGNGSNSSEFKIVQNSSSSEFK